MLTAAEAAAAEARMPAHRGASLTVDHLICEERERRQLREKYGASSVNMEDSAVAAAARRAAAPFYPSASSWTPTNSGCPATCRGWRGAAARS